VEKWKAEHSYMSSETFEHQLTELATDEETEGEDVDPNVGEDMAKMSGRYGLWGNDPA
jgi:hypothetical protein